MPVVSPQMVSYIKITLLEMYLKITKFNYGVDDNEVATLRFQCLIVGMNRLDGQY